MGIIEIVIMIITVTATITYFVNEARKPLPPLRNTFDRV